MTLADDINAAAGAVKGASATAEAVGSEIALLLQMALLLCNAVPPILDRIDRWHIELSTSQRLMLGDTEKALAEVRVAISTVRGRLDDIAAKHDAQAADPALPGSGGPTT